MKQIYNDVRPATGPHKGGICSLYVAPREWLIKDPVIDYETGRVMTVPQMAEDRFWIRLDLLQQSYAYEERPKSSASGDYKEMQLTGDLNFYNYLLLQQLETLRRSELVVLLTDRNKRRRLIGNSISGMLLNYAYSLAEEERVSLSLQIENEDPAPYYNPDGEPEIIYNLLENLDGNFLLIE